HRGNSVATLDAGRLPVGLRVERTEAWYRERGLPPAFQIGPCSLPSGLDDALADRGYAVEGEAFMALASPARVAAVTGGGGQATAGPAPSPDWTAVAVGASRFAAHEAALRGFLRRLGSRCRFAVVHDATGRPVASALGIASEARLGIYAMITVPDARRR